MDKLPRHIAIIMDGNGRWAKSKGFIRTQGHKKGVDVLKQIVEDCSDLGIEYLTVYAFSTENWKREVSEVDAIMKLVEVFLQNEINKIMKNNVKLKTIGDLAKLPKGVQKILHESIEKTKNNTGITLTVALNYGARDDILRATKKISEKIKNAELQVEDIDEKVFASHLDTAFLPDPDLVIRPSGELRLSNFLLWESAYSEFWYSNINWPDFRKENLIEAIESYQNRDRRFGDAK